MAGGRVVAARPAGPAAPKRLIRAVGSLALPLLRAFGVNARAHFETHPATLRVGVGVASHSDTLWAAVRATAMARAGLGGATPDIVLLVTAGVPNDDAVGTIRGILGPVGIAGGATAALLTDTGAVREGALVVGLATSEDAVSGVAAATGQDLAEASQGTARLILSGWPFRMRYPRGLGVAFARPGYGGPADTFLGPWRVLMGPKMRTVCSVLSAPVVYGSSSAEPIASAACLEAAYSTGLGFAPGWPDGDTPDRAELIRGAAEAAGAAVQRLGDDPPRLVLVIESTARHEALGAAYAEEWAAIRRGIDPRTPCVGWLCDRVAAYGRGVRPVDSQGALVVVALGDIPRR